MRVTVPPVVRLIVPCRTYYMCEKYRDESRSNWTHKFICDDCILSHCEVLHTLLYRYCVVGRLLSIVSLAQTLTLRSICLLTRCEACQCSNSSARTLNNPSGLFCPSQLTSLSGGVFCLIGVIDIFPGQAERACSLLGIMKVSDWETYTEPKNSY